MSWDVQLLSSERQHGNPETQSEGSRDVLDAIVTAHFSRISQFLVETMLANSWFSNVISQSQKKFTWPAAWFPDVAQALWNMRRLHPLARFC